MKSSLILKKDVPNNVEKENAAKMSCNAEKVKQNMSTKEKNM